MLKGLQGKFVNQTAEAEMAETKKKNSSLSSSGGQPWVEARGLGLGPRAGWGLGFCASLAVLAFEPSFLASGILGVPLA